MRGLGRLDMRGEPDGTHASESAAVDHEISGVVVGDPPFVEVAAAHGDGRVGASCRQPPCSRTSRATSSIPDRT